MKKRIASILLVVFLLLSCFPNALAADWLTAPPQPDAVDHLSESTAYNAADSVGKVVNGAAPTYTDEEAVTYSFTPMDVVLVIDHSSSMEATGGSSHNLLYYATTAAGNFAELLYDINPASRIAVVAYDHEICQVIGMTGHSDKDKVSSALKSISLGGRTDIGDAFLEADRILNAEKSGNPQAILLLTDGLANEGGNNPIQYAASCGKQAANGRLVFTFGLVGGMSEKEKKYTRSTLDAGYAKRYFEIDFDNVDDVSAQIYKSFTTALAIMEAESSENSNQNFYMMDVSDGIDVQIFDEQGNYLSTEENTQKNTAPFGSYSCSDDGNQFILNTQDEESLNVLLHGTNYELASCSIEKISSSEDQKSEQKAENIFYNYPGFCATITLNDEIQIGDDLAINLLDPDAVDPFTGEEANGTDYLAIGYIKASSEVTSKPDRKGEKLAKLSKGDRVYVIAKQSENDSALISYSDDLALAYGWIPAENVDAYGYVPEWTEYLHISVELKEQVNAFRAPDEDAQKADPIQAGTEITVLFAEEGKDGQEWLCAEVPYQKGSTYVYLPAKEIEGWSRTAKDGFGTGKEITLIAKSMGFQLLQISEYQKWDVWAAPIKGAYRGGGSKHNAYLGTKENVWAMGWVNEQWLMVLYEKSAGGYRVGFVDRDDVQEGTISAEIPPIYFSSRKAIVCNENCILSDDPFAASEIIKELNIGEEVNVLFTTDSNEYQLAYIQTQVENKVCNGFVIEEYLQYE